MHPFFKFLLGGVAAFAIGKIAYEIGKEVGSLQEQTKQKPIQQPDISKEEEVTEEKVEETKEETVPEKKPTVIKKIKNVINKKKGPIWQLIKHPNNMKIEANVNDDGIDVRIQPKDKSG